MSASEKLEALVGPHRLVVEEMDAKDVFWDALPEIIAVVEAAEAVHARICGCELPGGDDSPDPWVCFAGKELRALVALDEKLP